MSVVTVSMMVVPATSKNETDSFSISVMYSDENRAIIIISARHQVKYACVDILFFLSIRYRHPRVIKVETSTMQNSIVALKVKPACSMSRSACMLYGL